MRLAGHYFMYVFIKGLIIYAYITFKVSSKYLKPPSISSENIAEYDFVYKAI